MSEQFETYLAYAHHLADISGAAILPWFRKRHQIINKANQGCFDPVTEADKAGEEVIRAALGEAWPEHGLIGEEFGSRRADAALRWIVDPIDGTRGFIIGSPHWGTLIGLAERERPLLGVMNQPFTGDRFWSTANAAIHRSRAGEEIITTRSCASLDQAILVASAPDMFAAGFEQARFAAVQARVRMCRFGTDCIGYCLLAAGHLDLVIEADLKIYDIAALIPIIERAGGRVTTWQGESPLNGGRILAAGDPRLHDQALEILSG